MLKQAGEAKACLVTETGQLAMLESVRDSLPSYISGVRCWAAFNDALGRSQRFPVTESMAIEWAAVFSSTATFEQYLKHLRFVHKLLRFSNEWYTPSVVQVKKGIAKVFPRTKKKVALHSKVVRNMIRLVAQESEEMAALWAVSRMFLLRMPSGAAFFG